MTAVPFQQPGAPAAHGLTVADCERAAWAVVPGPAGDRFRGAGAVNAALATALQTALPLRLYRLPGLRLLEDAVYALVARYRSRLPGVRPYCEQFPGRCG